MKEFLARAKAHISLFMEHVVALPANFMKVITAGLRGLEQQVSSAKGIIVFIIIIMLVADITLGGRIGAIKYASEQGVGLLKEIISALKEAGIGIVLIVAVLWAAHLKK